MDVPPFRVAYVRGVTPTKWARIWHERRPERTLELIRTDCDQAEVLRDGRVQMAFVRLPIDQDGLNVIPLYQEIAVAVVPVEHPAAAVDDIVAADLDGETVHEATGDIDEVFALIAAGVGVVVVPQSIARLHARRDVTSRPVTDAPPTQIALAWLVESELDDSQDAAAIEDFIGIVRGRTARSSRGAGVEPDSVTPKDARGRRPRKSTNRARNGKPRRR